MVVQLELLPHNLSGKHAFFKRLEVKADLAEVDDSFPIPNLDQATVGAGTCIEEGGDPVPHLEALDPILAELTELEARVKKAPTEEVDDARC